MLNIFPGIYLPFVILLCELFIQLIGPCINEMIQAFSEVFCSCRSLCILYTNPLINVQLTKFFFIMQGLVHSSDHFVYFLISYDSITLSWDCLSSYGVLCRNPYQHLYLDIVSSSSFYMLNFILNLWCILTDLTMHAYAFAFNLICN